jgi:hypothetical protein
MFIGCEQLNSSAAKFSGNKQCGKNHDALEAIEMLSVYTTQQGKSIYFLKDASGFSGSPHDNGRKARKSESGRK